MYRGVHICSKYFVRIFRTEFRKKSSEVDGESNKSPLFANPYLLPQERIGEVDLLRQNYSIYSLPRSYQLLKMFYAHITNGQLPKEESKSFKASPLRSVVKDHELSEQNYFCKIQSMLEKANEPRGGIFQKSDKNYALAYENFAEYQTDTMPSQWPLTIDRYMESYKNQQANQTIKHLHETQTFQIFELKDELSGQCKGSGKQMELMLRNTGRIDPVLGDNDWRNIHQEIVEKSQMLEPLM